MIEEYKQYCRELGIIFTDEKWALYAGPDSDIGVRTKFELVKRLHKKYALLGYTHPTASVAIKDLGIDINFGNHVTITTMKSVVILNKDATVDDIIKICELLLP